MVKQVRRQQLLNDTVLQMRRANRMLKRPLKVKFIGEEGVDEGGITKEFFQVPDKMGFSALCMMYLLLAQSVPLLLLS